MPDKKNHTSSKTFADKQKRITLLADRLMGYFSKKDTRYFIKQLADTNLELLATREQLEAVSRQLEENSIHVTVANHKNGKITQGRIVKSGAREDVIERKRIEEFLRVSNERYNMVLKATNDAIWDWDLVTGKIFRSKEGLKKVYGYDDNTPIELIDKWAEQVHPDDRKKVDALIAEILQPNDQLTFSMEYRFRRPSGEYSYVHDRGYVIRNENGEAIRMIGAAQDITSRKKAEQQIAESERRYRTLFEQNMAGVYRSTIYGQMISCNHSFATMLGYASVGEALQVSPSALYFSNDNRDVFINELRKENKLNNYEGLLRKKDGSKLYVIGNITLVTETPSGDEYCEGVIIDITERKRAAAELKGIYEEVLASQELLKKGEKLAMIGSWHLEHETGIFQWSDEACRIYGYEPGSFEPTFTAFMQQIHPEDLNHVNGFLASKRDLSLSQKIDYRIIDQHGKIKHIHSEWMSETNKEGMPVRATGFSMNTTAIREAEAELKKLSLIASETTNGVFITDAKSNIQWVNKAFTRITGYEPHEVIGKRPRTILNGKESSAVTLNYIDQQLSAGKGFDCDMINYNKSGDKYWVRMQCQPQFDDQGSLNGFFVMQTDINNEKEAAEVLKLSEERYRYLFNNNPAVILIWDIEDYIILEVNDTAISEYDYSREEFLTLNMRDIKIPEEFEQLYNFAKTAMSVPDFKEVKTQRHISKSGEILFMNITAQKIPYKGKTAALAIAKNVTEQVMLERKLEEEQLKKQQEITAAVITAQENERQQLGIELHDNVNQILASSRIYLGMVKQQNSQSHPFITESEALILSAINEIRNLSHSLIPPSLSESQLINALDNIIDITGKSGAVTIVSDWKDFDESVVSDKLKLSIYRIVQEQFSNINKYARASNIEIKLSQENQQLMLQIKDDGVGFDTGTMSAGVGLMNIKTRASLYNGEMRIISAPGMGCELTVCFN